MKNHSLLYTKNVLSIKEFLKLNESFRVYHENIHSLATELCKGKSNLSTRIINNVSKARFASHNLRCTIILLCQENIQNILGSTLVEIWPQSLFIQFLI